MSIDPGLMEQREELARRLFADLVKEAPRSDEERESGMDFFQVVPGYVVCVFPLTARLYYSVSNPESVDAMEILGDPKLREVCVEEL